MSVNTLTARTDKIDGVTEDELTSSLLEAYPEYKVTSLVDLGDEWEATLEKPLPERISNRTRTSEFPPAEEKTEETEEKTEEKPDGDEEVEEKTEEKSDKPFDKEKGDGLGDKPDASLKSIEQQVKELLETVKKLEEKANVVDDIHNTIKPHVEDMSMGPGPGDLGPTAPGGGNPMGLDGPGGPGGGPGGPPGMGGPPGGGMGGGKPPVPRRPNIPSPNKPGNPKRGLPSSFTNTKVVFTPIYTADAEFSMTEAANAMAEKYPQYRVSSVVEDRQNNRWVGKLKLRG